MALYMYQASYTAKSMAAQIKEPQDPVEAFRPTLEDLGAKLLVAGFPFGDYDVLVVYEAPDDMTAASVAMAVAAAGEVKSGKTTRLLSGQEWLESLRKRRTVNMRKERQQGDSLHRLPELLSIRPSSPDGITLWLSSPAHPCPAARRARRARSPASAQICNTGPPARKGRARPAR
jgi:uncharacterized protein with GYD domain